MTQNVTHMREVSPGATRPLAAHRLRPQAVCQYKHPEDPAGLEVWKIHAPHEVRPVEAIARAEGVKALDLLGREIGLRQQRR